jgi:hypothetical protein
MFLHLNTMQCLTLNLLTTTIVALPSNASKWQIGFNSAFKGLKCARDVHECLLYSAKIIQWYLSCDNGKQVRLCILRSVTRFFSNTWATIKFANSILEGLFIMNLYQLDKQSTKFTI